LKPAAAALLAAALVALAAPVTAHAQAVPPAGLTDAAVRDFLLRQQRAWNAGDLDRYFALYAPDAVFADQARTPEGRIVPYGQATLAEARAQARRFLAKSKSTETGYVRRIEIAADGHSAQVHTDAYSRSEQDGRTRTACLSRVQTLTLAGSRLRSAGRTDSFHRCPR
jgi:hypothetical protein